jgi:hypothetical protein
MTARADRPIADDLERRGLGAAAELLAGAHRPLWPLLEDLATVADPLLRPLLGDRLGAVRRELDALRRGEDEG